MYFKRSGVDIALAKLKVALELASYLKMTYSKMYSTPNRLQFFMSNCHDLTLLILDSLTTQGIVAEAAEN